MSFLRGVVKLLCDSALDNAIDNAEGKASDAANAFFELFQGIMTIVMPIVFSVVLALGAFFCIKLGIAYAKTEKTDDREEAKKRLVGAIIGFSIGLLGAVVMWILFTSNALAGLFN